MHGACMCHACVLHELFIVNPPCMTHACTVLVMNLLWMMTACVMHALCMCCSLWTHHVWHMHVLCSLWTYYVWCLHVSCMRYTWVTYYEPAMHDTCMCCACYELTMHGVYMCHTCVIHELFIMNPPFMTHTCTVIVINLLFMVSACVMYMRYVRICCSLWTRHAWYIHAR